MYMLACVCQGMSIHVHECGSPRLTSWAALHFRREPGSPLNLELTDKTKPAICFISSLSVTVYGYFYDTFVQSLSSCAQFPALQKIPLSLTKSFEAETSESSSFLFLSLSNNFRNQPANLFYCQSVHILPSISSSTVTASACDLRQQVCPPSLLASCNLFSIQDSEGALRSTGHGSHPFECFQRLLAS